MTRVQWFLVWLTSMLLAVVLFVALLGILTLMTPTAHSATPHDTLLRIPCAVDHPRCDLPFDGRWAP